MTVDTYMYVYSVPKMKKPLHSLCLREGHHDMVQEYSAPRHEQRQ